MGMYEKMDCIKKLLAFSADELSTAEDYVDMMKMAQDQSMYNKFKEIAN